eukprot:gene10209-biopygen223
MGRGRYHRPVDLSWTREPGKGWNSAMDDIQVITLCWLSGQLLSPVRIKRLQQTEEVRPQGGGEATRRRIGERQTHAWCMFCSCNGILFRERGFRTTSSAHDPPDPPPPPPPRRAARARDGTGGWSSFPTVSGPAPVPSLASGKLPRSLVFAPRSEPPHARATGAQMIRMASGSSLAFQRLSRASRAFLASGWRVGISTLRTERGRDREQVGQ